MKGNGSVMAQKSPTVFIVDDEDQIRKAIGLLLETVKLPYREFASAADFLSEFDPETPGCIVLDLRMPGMSGMELQSRLSAMGSTLPIVFVTAHGDVPTAVEAVKAGAVDFIQKPFQDQKLLDMIHEALDRDAKSRRDRKEVEAIEGRMASLTPREREVMVLVTLGRRNKTIARELGISQRTVEVHRARVMEKMRVRSVSELVQMVLRTGEEP